MQIPGYELLATIAAGGMATVYLARRLPQSDPERLVAIKQCHPHLRHDPTFVSMFSDEARLASLIRHRNVVEILDLGSAESLYFVMQYVEGVSLAEWLTRATQSGQHLAAPLLLRVVLDCLSGLAAAHALTDRDGNDLRLVHRDISPQNILIGLDGVAKISDFGIAKAEARATRTRTGQVKGKAGYMSPEQILLEPLDQRSDLYAVGVVLWEALTGRRLFDGDSDASIINQILSGRVPAPSTVKEDAASLDTIVLRALSFKPSDRYSTALDFARAIESVGIPVAEPIEVGAAIAEQFGASLLARRNSGPTGTLEDPLAKRAPTAQTETSNESFSVIAPYRWSWLVRSRWLVIGVLLSATGLVLSWLSRHSESTTTKAPTESAIQSLPARPSSVARMDAARRVPASSSTPSTGSLAVAPSAPISPSASPTSRELVGAHRPSRGSVLTRTTSPAPVEPKRDAPISTVATASANTQRKRSKPSEYRPSDL